MNSFYESDALCEINFRDAGICWHLWTKENHPVIFSSIDDFSAGMTVMGIAAKLCPKVRILTFELMSNHIHIVISGYEFDVDEFFNTFKKLLDSHFKGGRRFDDSDVCLREVDLSDFVCSKRVLESVSEIRNVIAYDNRNGYLVSPDESPYTYPWGANRYYFNRDAKFIAKNCSSILSKVSIRKIIFTHLADKINPPRTVYGYACPYDFCDIETGERMFRNASHYFHIISRSLESYSSIAKEISESIFYTDDELYSAVTSLARKQYNLKLSELDKNAKTNLAKTMHYDYNASNKQISRILKLSPSVLELLFH